MTRTAPSLATMSRAYVSGRVAALRPPIPHQAHRMSEALAQAAPEVAAAYELGRAADPHLPLPGAQDVLAQVVQRDPAPRRRPSRSRIPRRRGGGVAGLMRCLQQQISSLAAPPAADPRLALLARR